VAVGDPDTGASIREQRQIAERVQVLRSSGIWDPTAGQLREGNEERKFGTQVQSLTLEAVTESN
jgi:hypothetical protein